jgi:hypothetical protein
VIGDKIVTFVAVAVLGVVTFVGVVVVVVVFVTLVPFDGTFVFAVVTFGAAVDDVISLVPVDGTIVVVFALIAEVVLLYLLVGVVEEDVVVATVLGVVGAGEVKIGGTVL